MNNALPALNAKEDKHNVFNDGKDRTIRYVEWKDEMKTKARSCAKHHGIKVLMGDSRLRSSNGGVSITEPFYPFISFRLS